MLECIKMKMPYGKYKGKSIKDLPSSYLKWIAENWKEDTKNNKKICMTADKEWHFRQKYNQHFEEE